MPVQAKGFAAYARNPETWLLGARRHLAVAELLLDHVAALRTQSSQLFDELSGCHYAGFLHSGLAVENAVKAVLVSEDPTIVLNDSLDRKKLGGKAGHGLRGLVQSVLNDLSEDELQLLSKLEEYVIWAGKYTVPMNADVLCNESVMSVLRISPTHERDLIRSLVTRLSQKVQRG